jgi:AraC-like DNA-binding protein
MREPHLTALALRPLIAGLHVLGHDAQAVCAACGIEHRQLADPEARFAQSSVMRFWREALERTGDGNLGLHLAAAAPLGAFDIYTYALLGSATMREAFVRACRYQRLIHESTVLTLLEEPAGARLRHSRADGAAVPRQPAEFLAATWLRFARLLVPGRWAPQQVTFAHPAPQDRREHSRLFGRGLRFDSAATTLLLPARVLDAPNARADPGLAVLLDGYAETLLARSRRAAGIVGRVREQLARLLMDGAPNAAAVAKALGTSVRSLHRQLRAEDTNLRRMFDTLRHEQAVQLLRQSTRSLAEIAFLLGFSELSAFYRAFRRWTGMTPARFRSRR